jgi:hypothetical protein
MKCERCGNEIPNVVIVAKPPSPDVTYLSSFTAANRIFCSEKCWLEQQKLDYEKSRP